MFENAIWKSRSHAKQPLWFLMGPMLVFLVAIPFMIHFFGVGLIFGIDVALTIVLLIVICAIGRKFKWNNGKLLFAAAPAMIFFTNVTASNGSYFSERFENVKGYSSKPDGNFVTVTVYFKQPTNAGVFGNLSSMKMIKIENFEKLQAIFQAAGLPLVEESKSK